MQFKVFGTGMHRRDLLKLLPSVPAAALMGCSISESNGVTTVTLNVSEVDSYCQAIVTGAKAVLGLSPVAGALGTASVATITAALTVFAAAVTAWDKSSGGSETFTLDSSSWSSVGSTLISDAEKLATDLEGIPAAIESSVSTSIYTEASTAIAGATTALAFLKALFSTFVSAVSVSRVGARPLMTRVQAFHAVGMTVPTWAASLDAADEGLPLGASRARLVRVTSGGQVLFTGGAAR